MGLATASRNALGKSLLFPLESNARVKEAVRRCQGRAGLTDRTCMPCSQASPERWSPLRSCVGVTCWQHERRDLHKAQLQR